MSDHKAHKWDDLPQSFALAELKAGLEWKQRMMDTLAELGGGSARQVAQAQPGPAKRGRKSNEERARIAQQNGDAQEVGDGEYEELDAE